MLHLTPAATIFLHRSHALRMMKALCKAAEETSSTLMTFTESVRADEVEYRTRGGRLGTSDAADASAGPLSWDSNDATKLLNAEWCYGTHLG